jgi:anion-transporting  ArsA/GET3 family ATPase
VRGRDPETALGEALREKRIIIVSGSGGVGKTTTAAALALHAGLMGRRVLVCTIDPSRRLATSLGLSRLSGRPRALDISRFRPAPGGAVSAMTLDTKTTFDELVERYAPDEGSRRRILGNAFYEQVSSALAGSHEYMAMEKLLDLEADPRYDLVVLDTPPTRHALDFLEAPDRMLSFLDTSILRFFLKPYFAAGRLTLKVATKTGAMALRLVDRYLGLQFLQDLSEFFLAFEGMYAGFKERAGRVHELLRRPSSGFVLVASPARPALDEALFFFRRLGEKRMPFVCFVVNRLHPDPEDAAGVAPRGAPRATVDAELARRLLSIYEDQRALAALERRAVARLEVDTAEPLILVPELEADVHDLRGLKEVGDLMVPSLAASNGRVAPRERARSSQP